MVDFIDFGYDIYPDVKTGKRPEAVSNEAEARFKSFRDKMLKRTSGAIDSCGGMPRKG